MSKNAYNGINDEIIKQVQFYAKKLKSIRNFKLNEIEDIEQELLLFVFSKVSNYKQDKSKFITFLSHILKNKVKNLIKQKARQKGESGYTFVSYEEADIQISDEFSESLNKTADINTFVHKNLPKKLQETYELLKHNSVKNTALLLNKSPTAIYQRIRRIRQLMDDLRDYDTTL